MDLPYRIEIQGFVEGEHAMSMSAVEREVREVMDIRQASDYLGISPDTLYKYAADGFVPAFKLGNRWRFKLSRLDEWMDLRSSTGAPLVQPQPQSEAIRPKRPQSVRPKQKKSIRANR
jgi:excisionase family DNA binding protein